MVNGHVRDAIVEDDANATVVAGLLWFIHVGLR
jgi:hypothetical protein